MGESFDLWTHPVRVWTRIKNTDGNRSWQIPIRVSAFLLPGRDLLNVTPQNMRPYESKGAYFEIKTKQRKRRTIPTSTDYRLGFDGLSLLRRTVPLNDGLSTLEVENHALFDIII